MDVRSQACSYLRTGRVKIHVAVPPDDMRRAAHIVADVEGYRSTYVVQLTPAGWTCTCGHPDQCAHVASVQLVTGYPSLARKEAKGGTDGKRR